MRPRQLRRGPTRRTFLLGATLLLAACQPDRLQGPATSEGPVPGAMTASVGPRVLGTGGTGPTVRPSSATGPVLAAAPTSPAPAGLALSSNLSALVPSSASQLATTEPTSHLLWQNTTTGHRGFWAMSGAYPSGGWQPLTVIGVEWEIACTADFDADGRQDILWRNRSSGDWGFWLMDGTAPSARGYVPLTNIATSWRVVGCADVTADQKPDLLWRNATTGDLGFWVMDGTGPSAQGYVPLTTIDAVWQVAALADFSGDGKPDLLWQNLSTGDRGFWLLNGTGPSSGWLPLTVIAGTWKIRLATDANGDGKPDILWHNTASGERGWWLLDGTSAHGVGYTPLTTIANEWDIASFLPAAAAQPSVIVTTTGPLVQAAVEGRALAVLPAVRLADASGAPLAGRQVTFSITSGGGSSGSTTATTNADGIATMASWTLGAVAGPNTVTATVAGTGVSGNGAVFTAIGCTGGGSASAFTINVCFTTPMTDAQRAAFVDAAARWGSVITGDIPDLTVGLANPSCGASAPALHLAIDDLLIFARIEAIDGPNQVLGSAGWCYRRTGGLPLIGGMRFDDADVPQLITSGQFGSVILHEMGHVLGIGGSLWSAMGFLQNPSVADSLALDTHFNGPNAISGFDQIGGLGYTTGQKVPVENTMGPGSINSHWRESVLANELMTPVINSGTNPLTVLTALSLRDLGYVVDATKADQSSMSQMHADGAREGPAIDLGRSIRDVPKHTIDRDGRIARVP